MKNKQDIKDEWEINTPQRLPTPESLSQKEIDIMNQDAKEKRLREIMTPKGKCVLDIYKKINPEKYEKIKDKFLRTYMGNIYPTVKIDWVDEKGFCAIHEK